MRRLEFEITDSILEDVDDDVKKAQKATLDLLARNPIFGPGYHNTDPVRTPDALAWKKRQETAKQPKP